MYKLLVAVPRRNGFDAITGYRLYTQETTFTEAGLVVALHRLGRTEELDHIYDMGGYVVCRDPQGKEIRPVAPAERRRLEEARQAYLNADHSQIPF